MAQAARAIIIENGKLLVMRRDKYGSEYFTLVGGRLSKDETPEQAVIREVREETGLEVTSCRLVFTEQHAAPYNDQFIFLCEVAPHDIVTIQDSSEEGLMNRFGGNLHAPLWVEANAFAHLPFRTAQLQAAIVTALKQGFPVQPIKL